MVYRNRDRMPKASKVKVIKTDGTVVYQPSFKTAKAMKAATYNQSK